MTIKSRSKGARGANKELWLPVDGYEGFYEISSNGRVRSVDRKVRHPTVGKITLKGKVMSLYKSRHNGYVYVSLSGNGKNTSFRVHRLVLKAFLPTKNRQMGGYLSMHKKEGDAVPINSKNKGKR